MRKLQTALCHRLYPISKAELVAQIPAYAQDDHFAVEMPTRKQFLHALQRASFSQPECFRQPN